jgi:hypothetical protein
VAVAAQEARVLELQSEVQRLRSSAQTYLRDEREVREGVGACPFLHAGADIAGSHHSHLAGDLIASLVLRRGSQAHAGSIADGCARLPMSLKATMFIHSGTKTRNPKGWTRLHSVLTCVLCVPHDLAHCRTWLTSVQRSTSRRCSCSGSLTRSKT